MSQRVAVVIPAKDEATRIAATIRAARFIPLVDLVLVVDDGSEDNTQHLAREAGAVVVRHPQNRGKAAAMETGAAVVAMRDSLQGPPRALLFIDADLGETAIGTAPLIRPVLEGQADMSVAVLPRQPGAAGHGFVIGLARRAIVRASGWNPEQPLSGMRCLTREAFEAALPLAHGWGVETGMTLDLLNQGFRVVEVHCEIFHKPSGADLRGQLHRAAQYRDVALAINARRVRRLGAAIGGGKKSKAARERRDNKAIAADDGASTSGAGSVSGAPDSTDRAKAALPAEPAVKSKPAATPKPTTEAKPATEPKPATKAKPATEAKPAEAKPAKAKPAAAPKPATEAKPAKAKPATEAKPATRSKPASAAKPAAKKQSAAAARSTKTTPAEAKPAPEAKPAAKKQSAAAAKRGTPSKSSRASQPTPDREPTTKARQSPARGAKRASGTSAGTAEESQNQDRSEPDDSADRTT